MQGARADEAERLARISLRGPEQLRQRCREARLCPALGAVRVAPIEALRVD